MQNARPSNPKPISKRFQRTFAGVSLTAIVLILIAFGNVQPIVLAQESGNSNETSSRGTADKHPAFAWTLTKRGWMDLNQLERPTTTPSRFDRLHPFVLAALLFLAVIAAIIWSAKDGEVDRLFSRSAVKRKSPPRAPENVGKAV